MEKYEFKTVFTEFKSFDGGHEGVSDRLQEDINKTLIEGWEFVSSIPTANGTVGSHVISIFRREIK